MLLREAVASLPNFLAGQAVPNRHCAADFFMIRDTSSLRLYFLRIERPPAKRSSRLTSTFVVVFFTCLLSLYMRCDNHSMSTKALMDVSEYLRTSFEGPDCEYLDGEIVERNMGELPHGDVQLNLGTLLRQMRKRLGLRVVPEIRIQISPTRYRVADLAVWRDDNIGTGIPTVAPFLVVEILSPEDRMVRMLPKIQEYLSIGVEWIWIVDPQEQSALLYSQQNPAGAVCDILRTENPSIEIPLTAAFDLNA
jgi:Uma2 family endonuclease